MRQTLLLNVVVLGSFVVLFGSIYRKRPSPRLRSWISAWSWAVVHFALLLIHPESAFLQTLATAALLMSAFYFLFSLPRLEWLRSRRLLPLPLLAVALVLAASDGVHVQPLSVFLAGALICQCAALVGLWRYSRDLQITVPCTVLILVCSQWISMRLIARQSDDALAVLLMELFAGYALLFSHDMRRRTAGVWTTIGGLGAWAAVFPLGMLLGRAWPSLTIDPEIWNVPKVVVAFGMLVTLFEDELLQAELEREQYRSLFERNPLPMWIFDTESTQLLEVNLAAEQSFGWTRRDLAGLTISHLVSERDPSPVGLVELNWRLAGKEAAGGADGSLGGQAKAESMHFQTSRGVDITVEVTLQRVRFGGRESSLLVAKDITAQAAEHDQLMHRASHDPLTGLPNRLLLQDRMETALAAALRHGRKAAILCIDLDRFKKINDTHGHAAGDSCLVEVADRLRQRLRSVDTAARTGGEEFTVILDDVGNLQDAELVVNDLLFTLSAPHSYEGERIQLSASIGIALFPDDGSIAGELWKRADAAMYRAKQGGGNRHRFFSRA